jgi:hypothetical protein
MERNSKHRKEEGKEEEVNFKIACFRKQRWNNLILIFKT